LERFVTKDERAKRLIDERRMSVTVKKAGTHLGLATDSSVEKAIVEGLNARPSKTDAALEPGSHGRADAPRSTNGDPLDAAIRDPLSWVSS